LSVRILVTGAAGFVGSHLCERLVRDGHSVIGVDAFVGSYPASVKRRNLAALDDSTSFTFHAADLRTDPLDPILDGVAVVINEAAVAGLAPSWADLGLYASCNIVGLGRLIEASERAGVDRFVQISTSSVYGLEAVGDEERPKRPSSPYGVTKLAAEHLVQAHVDAYGLPALLLRYFSIYGPRQRPDMAYHRFTEAMLDGRSITVFGDGEQSRSNTYVDDAVEATVRAMDGGVIGEAYNIGGGASLTVNQAIAILAEEIGIEPEIRHAPAQHGDQRHTMADTTKAHEAFGFRPVVQPAEGLRRQVAWHRKARDGAD
jgi:UDP-glucuronate 4-epimerase